MQHIGLYWENSVGENTTDIFSESDFKENCSDKLLIHPVLAQGKLGFAFCLMTVKNNIVLLDYRPFPISNIAEDMLLGQLQLQLKREDKVSISEASWHNEDGQVEQIQFESKWPKRRPRPPKRIYDLLQEEVISGSDDFAEILNSSFGTVPKKVTRTTKVFLRNPVVVKKALTNANGTCQICNKSAPFISKKTGHPYLEVHHINPLSEGGEDSLANVLAICPNCHREKHFGALQ